MSCHRRKKNLTEDGRPSCNRSRSADGKKFLTLSCATILHSGEEKKNPNKKFVFSLKTKRKEEEEKKKQAEMDKIHTLVFGDASEQLMQLSALFLPNGRNH